jgi:hypothetical protein
MESIIKLITRPEFYIYLQLCKNAFLPKIRNPCVMCRINDAIKEHHANLQKRLKFVNRNGVKYTASNLCYDCANPKMILFMIYHYNNLDVFNKALTYCHPKDLNHFMIGLYLKNYRSMHIDSKIIYLISNAKPKTYNWENGWKNYSEHLLKYGNEINTSNCMYSFVMTHHFDFNKTIGDEFIEIIKFKTSNMFDKILDLDYLGDPSRIMAILFIAKLIKIEVDEKSNLGKLVKMLQL